MSYILQNPIFLDVCPIKNLSSGIFDGLFTRSAATSFGEGASAA